MSFATQAAAFAQQAARERQTLSPARVQPYTGSGGATKDGGPVAVFLSAVRAERELDDKGSGFETVQRATLRVLKTCSWQPVEGNEFVDLATSQRYRVHSATGATSDFAADIVCEVTQIFS